MNEESSTKPLFLYHASRNPNIAEFEPRMDHTRSDQDGPVVFATADKAYASAFLIPWDDSWVQCVNHNGAVILAVSDKEKFLADDVGGAIYELPSNSFSNVEPGTDHPEWMSKEKVKPTRVEKVTSAIDTMLENGVQLYFVDPKTFEQMRADTTHYGLDMLKNMKSENEERGIEVKKW